RELRARMRVGLPPQTLEVNAEVGGGLVTQFEVFFQALSRISSSFGGSWGLSSNGATGARWRIASNTAALVGPENAGRPVAISYRTIPRENRSVRRSNSSPMACSGDM